MLGHLCSFSFLLRILIPALPIRWFLFRRLIRKWVTTLRSLSKMSVIIWMFSLCLREIYCNPNRTKEFKKEWCVADKGIEDFQMSMPSLLSFDLYFSSYSICLPFAKDPAPSVSYCLTNTLWVISAKHHYFSLFFFLSGK